MTATPHQGAPVLTVQEAADYLRISRGLAVAAARDGSLPIVRIRRRILIPAGSCRRHATAPSSGPEPAQVTSRSRARPGCSTAAARMAASGTCAWVTAASKVARSPSRRPGTRWPYRSTVCAIWL